MSSIDWLNLPWAPQLGQESWPRRRLTETPELLAINHYIADHVNDYGSAVGVEFDYADTYWWLDEPGFTVPIHTDGHLPSSMQLFWHMPGTDFGTVFYRSKNPADVDHAFAGTANTGYLMLNKLNSDGSQPLQWHGMLNPVPDNSFRVCSYTIFGDYKHKYTYERN